MPGARRIKFSTPFKHHFRPDDLIRLLLQLDRRARYYYKATYPSLPPLSPGIPPFFAAAWRCADRASTHPRCRAKISDTEQAEEMNNCGNTGGEGEGARVGAVARRFEVEIEWRDNSSGANRAVDNSSG
jgi:hypothetical protein